MGQEERKEGGERRGRKGDGKREGLVAKSFSYELLTNSNTLLHFYRLK